MRGNIIKEMKGPGKRGHIVAHDVCWAAQTGKHLLRTQNVSEQNQPCSSLWLLIVFKIRSISCVRNKCRARGQTRKHLCRQQCVLVCQGLNVIYKRFPALASVETRSSTLPCSSSRYWSGTSLEWRLTRGIITKRDKCHLHLKRLPAY